MQVLFSITNADYQNASSVEKVTKLPPPVYMRNLLALIQVSSALIVIITIGM